jgi:hypothetical protein
MDEGLDNMKIHEIQPTLACSWMRGLGRFARMGVLGDGSCFFHSVCALTNRDDYLYKTDKEQKEIALDFRCGFADKFDKEIHKKLSKKSKNTEKTYEEHSANFCSLKTWADEVMIRYASLALDFNLIFIDLSTGKAYCGVHGEKAEKQFHKNKKITQKTGIIAWVGRKHFEPIIRLDNPDTGEITTIFEPKTSKEDQELINTIMDKYTSTCDL